MNELAIAIPLTILAFLGGLIAGGIIYILGKHFLKYLLCRK